jgi:RimJ/RimL family protein N-acetyltransferase
MKTRRPSNQAIAQMIPDQPRWVEARALLLHHPCKIFGFQTEPGLSLIVREPDKKTAFVIGAPSMAALQTAIHDAPCDEIIAAPEMTSTLLSMLPGWVHQRILVHHLVNPERLPETDHQVRFLDPSLLGHLVLDDELREELEEGAKQSLIAATFVNDQPVSFCYAGAVTERWWDVSIDTLPDHHRKGFAALCAAFMIRHMQASDKHPVWQALEDNPASWLLAQKLGFAPIDEIAFLAPREQE